MGGSHSIPLPRYSCCIRPQNPDSCRENHAEAYRRHHRNTSASSKSLPPFSGSASFSGADQPFPADAAAGVVDDEASYGLLDINTATAEEFMTLPGINRATASSIVDYRRQLGSFRKIEDLALVPGVGATRFGHVRTEIYASSQVPVRSGSSAASSVTSSGIDVMMDLDNVSHFADEQHGAVRLSVIADVTSVLDNDQLVDDLVQIIIKYRCF